MARTRKTSKEALEEKIEKAEADVIAAKKKYDQATGKSERTVRQARCHKKRRDPVSGCKKWAVI